MLKIKASELTLDKVYFAIYPEKELLHVHDTANRDCPVGKTIIEALLPIFEESERQLILSLQNKTLKVLIDEMYKIYNNKNNRRENESGTNRTI